MIKQLLLRALVLSVCAMVPSMAAGLGGQAKVSDLAKDPAEWLKSLTIGYELEGQLWAEGAAARNAVAIDVDEQGRVYVAQTERFRAGIEDVRKLPKLLESYRDDYYLESNEERRELLTGKWAPLFPADHFTKLSEMVHQLVDTDGDGKADQATLFADGFNDVLDGTAAGIMARDGKVYLASIPNVWVLEDQDGDGQSDVRGVVADGFGPRFSISGHDLHGLVTGPDGRIYFSVGDRGYNITTKEGKTFKDTRSGAVFRCDPDGSNLELFYYNLRNPQDLVFDDWGNLFTTDNDADGKDKARLMYLVEGGDGGWSHGWQVLGRSSFAEALGLSGPQPNAWEEEGMWEPPFAGQPAWMLPAVGNITAGPSGMAHYPGVGFGDVLRDRFFVCDYKSSAGVAGVWSFKLKEEGAGYVMPEKQVEKLVWGVTATDLAFGYDGSIYVSDFIGGWGPKDYGRVLSLSHPIERDSEAVSQLSKLMSSGFAQRSEQELADLLSHADRRVRQRAQFMLVSRGVVGQRMLATAATVGSTSITRVHGVWGLGQLARQDLSAAQPLVDLISDTDPRVREQAIKTLGDLRYAPAADAFSAALADEQPRVQAVAAIALGRLGHQPAFGAVVDMLASSDGSDPYLRHAGMMGLLGTGDATALTALAQHEQPTVRMTAVLALRRLKNQGLAAYVDDVDGLVRAEAMRAISDQQVHAVLPALLQRIQAPLGDQVPQRMADMIALRVVRAMHAYGDERAAEHLAHFAANAKHVSSWVRLAALATLETWDEVPPVDPILGLPRVQPASVDGRPIQPAALKDHLLQIIDDRDSVLLASAVRLAQAFGYGLPDPVLFDILLDTKAATDVRIEALAVLHNNNYQPLMEALPALVDDPTGDIRRAAYQVWMATDSQAAITAGIAALERDGNSEPHLIPVTYHSKGAWLDTPIGVPTSGNIAPQGTVTYVEGYSLPHPDAGGVRRGRQLPRLNDGLLATNEDDIHASVWFRKSDWRFMLDLGAEVDVGRVDTFSWHASNRAPQHFVLWGANGDEPPAADLRELGTEWTRLAMVNTKRFGAGGKHVSAVVNANGSLGRFRWLLWANHSNDMPFISEVAVYPQSNRPGGLVRVISNRSRNPEGAWTDLPMRGPDASGAALSNVSATLVADALPIAFAGAQDKADVWPYAPPEPAIEAAQGEAAPADQSTPKHHKPNSDNIRWLVDLHDPVELARVSTYGWDDGKGSGLDFTLWASAAEVAPDANSADLDGAGWQFIADVKTTMKAPQIRHAAAVVGLGESLGQHRWLLWQHHRGALVRNLHHIDIHPVSDQVPTIRRNPSPSLIALQQQVIQEFSARQDDQTGAVLHALLDQLNDNTLLMALALDLVKAVEARQDVEQLAKLQAYRDGLDPENTLAPYLVSMHGGDPRKGEEIFKFHAMSCMQCHSVKSIGGDAGPDLAGVGKRLSTPKLLASLIDPSRDVAAEYGLTTVTLADGTTLSGETLRNDEVGVVLRLQDKDKTEKLIARADISDVVLPISAMPPMGALLTPDELRDLMAYLKSVK